ncbi:type IV secretion-system TraD DNA-bindingdomain-containing protein [Sphingobium cloacae]|uniref:Type IV secretion-system TraD DNA-bindingdomain-containing protein n=1 Tax=Sphingobium cloacae TaxID=120107 RepID=A0A1E1F4B5_9SPHN|nr:type IV secretion-system TraD DNA-bindingdomain-containing protein [Sphingobium cloacae]
MNLTNADARARKYGGCGILGFQSYPQLRATYGQEDAAAITGYCSTWVALRANDTDTAEHVSKNLGRVEQVEANEGMSYGVNDMRDGVNLSRMQVTRPLR